MEIKFSRQEVQYNNISPQFSNICCFLLFFSAPVNCISFSLFAACWNKRLVLFYPEQKTHHVSVNIRKDISAALHTAGFLYLRGMHQAIWALDRNIRLIHIYYSLNIIISDCVRYLWYYVAINVAVLIYFFLLIVLLFLYKDGKCFGKFITNSCIHALCMQLQNLKSSHVCVFRWTDLFSLTHTGNVINKQKGQIIICILNYRLIQQLFKCRFNCRAQSVNLLITSLLQCNN